MITSLIYHLSNMSYTSISQLYLPHSWFSQKKKRKKRKKIFLILGHSNLSMTMDKNRQVQNENFIFNSIFLAEWVKDWPLELSIFILIHVYAQNNELTSFEFFFHLYSWLVSFCASSFCIQLACVWPILQRWGCTHIVCVSDTLIANMAM